MLRPSAPDLQVYLHRAHRPKYFMTIHPKILLLSSTDSDFELPKVAEMVFQTLGVTLWEMRYSENHENGCYFAGYAQNALLHVDDYDSPESKYQFQLTIYPPVDWKPGVGCIAESLDAIATALAHSGFKVFEPTGNWFHSGWDGSGRKYGI
jgi:hypothetical protein